MSVLSLAEFEALLGTGIPVCAVIGDPIAHSKSPLIHNAAFSQFPQLKSWHYVAVHVSSSDLDALQAMLSFGNLMGLNITIPHKVAVKDFTPHWDEEVQQTGAANTLYKSENEWRLANTDIVGFLSPLQGCSIGKAIVLGSGGAARAAAFALSSKFSAEVTVVSRSNITSTSGNEWLKAYSLSGYHDLSKLVQQTDILVNTTPVGMGDLKGQSPVSQEILSQLEGKIVYDLIYNPLKTELLRLAEIAGARIISGVDMFVGQAQASFLAWTGQKFDSETIKNILLKELNR